MKNIRMYVNECYICQRMKNHMEVPVERLIANKVLKKL